jgi:glycosyltransferase involved in cell wall biosynthesis
MRVALVTPLNARSTGVADYSLDLLPHLARAVGSDVVVLTQDTDRPQPGCGDGWMCRPITELPRLASQLDLIVYQMGNSPAHDFIAPYLLEYPGLVVLHDLSLHDFYVRQATLAGRLAVYMRAFGFGYGVQGTRLARRYLREPMQVGYPEYLLSEWLAVRSPGVIVHSHHAAALLTERCPAARIWFVPMPVPLPDQIASTDARAQLGLAADTYLIVLFGVLNLSKNPIAVLEALKHLRAAHVPARVAFIGLENTSFRLSPEVERRGLQADVIQLGYVDDLATVHLWLSAADVAVGLRSIYWGETPASALRVLAGGLPLLINDVGAFAELPDSSCVKIAPDTPDTGEALYAVLEDLYREPDRRQAMGVAARDYIGRKHSPVQVATCYVRIAEAILNGW